MLGACRRYDFRTSNNLYVFSEADLHTQFASSAAGVYTDMN